MTCDSAQTGKEPAVSDRSSLYVSELEAIFRVSCVLSRSLNLQETLSGVIEALHDDAGMRSGMVTLLDADTAEQWIAAAHDGDPVRIQTIRYGVGEGLVGSVIKRNETIIIERLADDPRFLDRLGIYDPNLPFIGVPIHVGDGEAAVGVVAAQPETSDRELLSERARFMEMVGNLVSQSVRLSWEVARERRDLTDERDRLRRAVRGSYGFDNIVGHTPAMKRIFEQVRQVAKWNTTVLIRGESGTGKELVAHAIHYNSPRSNGPFIKLNCAALPDNLLETELFGHEKGAFTGAVNKREGRFEQANGGTLFLDEVGEISPTFQAKLLRVLQEGEFERVGGTRTLKVDVRIIAATNRDLESEVEAGDFREDLYYRLNVMPIFMPPLRERLEDIPDLSEYLVGKLSAQQGRPLKVTESAMRLLIRHPWPGNVRELENCLERAAVMSQEGVIDREAVIMAGINESPAPSAPSAASPPSTSVDLEDESLDERERVIAALEQAGWVQAKAARLLGMTPRQIAYRIKVLKIQMRQF